MTQWKGTMLAACAAGAAVAASPALAQNDDFNLENWDYDSVYDGWSAEDLKLKSSARTVKRLDRWRSC